MKPNLFRELTAALLCGMLLQSAHAAAPGWWSSRGVLAPQAPEDDYAALNQGQLKNVARAAIEELNARVPGGAGESLTSMLSAWRTQTGDSNDYAVVTIGQFKALSTLFYDRLTAQGHIATPPWTEGSGDDDDYAVANVGQAKMTFGFVIPDKDTDGDGYFDATEIAAGTDPLDVNSKPEGPVDIAPRFPPDTDEDGVSDADEALAGTDPVLKDAPSVQLVVHVLSSP